ncbi:MAG: hypothetical protein Kow0059_00260 [Candidatus Sumerlaeia bacterium]
MDTIVERNGASRQPRFIEGFDPMNKLKMASDSTRNFLKEVKVEMKKVSWPNRQELTSYTITVLVTVVVVSLIIGIEDKFLGFLLEQFLKISSKS